MTVFLSYSRKDYFFAELLQIKLNEAGINIWKDKGNLLAGTDWRNGIESSISECIAVIIALSEHSTESSYVTYEWAYAIGKGKPVIPIKIANWQMHPRLEAIQYLDFTISSSLPWDLLTERIKEIEEDTSVLPDENNAITNTALNQDQPTVKAILDYLNQRGYQMASFERIRSKVDKKLTNSILETLIQNNSTIFRQAILRDNKKGIAKLIP